ncbi:MAG: sporulation transcriptional regulator SpoIIID [Clostridia bacterium]|nr:sporulation transcriptional regulator SpoIIID [Clostridia bacterium]
MKKKVAFGLVLSLLIFICYLGITVFALKPEQYAMAVKIGNYIIENNATQMATAKAFKVSQKTIRNYIEKLKEVDDLLYEQVKKITEQHKHLGSGSVFKPENWSPLASEGKRRRNLVKLKEQDALAVEIGNYMVKNNATYLEIATEFEISDMKVRRYIKKLEKIKPELYEQVKKIVEQHRHLGSNVANPEKQCFLMSNRKRIRFTYEMLELYTFQCDCEFL